MIKTIIFLSLSLLTTPIISGKHQKRHYMKTHKELLADIEAQLTDRVIDADSLSIYFLKPTGNIKEDFYTFTHSQGGGMSNNLTDPYLKNGGKFPPEPFSDGKKYHTVGDITWQTFKTKYPKATSNDFYNMPKEIRMSVVDSFLKKGNKTTSPATNILFTYCYWRGYHFEYETYKEWYKSDVNKDIKDLGEMVVFTRVTDIMLYINNSLKGAKVNTGWRKGILSAFKLFRNYCKN